jgi:hypothetical protein
MHKYISRKRKIKGPPPPAVAAIGAGDSHAGHAVPSIDLLHVESTSWVARLLGRRMGEVGFSDHHYDDDDESRPRPRACAVGFGSDPLISLSSFHFLYEAQQKKHRLSSNRIITPVNHTRMRKFE